MPLYPEQPHSQNACDSSFGTAFFSQERSHCSQPDTMGSRAPDLLCLLCMPFPVFSFTQILNCPTSPCSQTNLTAPSAGTFPKRATVDMKTFVPSTTQASMDLLCETVPSRPGWKEPSVTLWPCVALWPHGCYHGALPPIPSTTFSIWVQSVCHHQCVMCALSSAPASRDWPSGPHLCSLQLPPGSSCPSRSDC